MSLLSHQTLAYFASFFSLGATIAFLGPTPPFLADNSGASLTGLFLRLALILLDPGPSVLLRAGSLGYGLFPWSLFVTLTLTNYLFKTATEAVMTPWPTSSAIRSTPDFRTEKRPS